MTIVNLERFAARVASSAAPKLRTFRARVLDIVDALVEARMHRAQEEISRVSAARRMHGDPRAEPPVQR
jgi:hypothetical protein